jgi:MoaA/NifB/PqqE/SkfB family radical SAM enzyme
VDTGLVEVFVGRRDRGHHQVWRALERGPIAHPLPSELQIEVTSRCNLHCPGCIRTSDRPEPDADLTLEDYRDIVADLPALERVTFHLNGESLLAADLFDMVHEARASGAHTVLNTNGTLLDARRRRALLDSGLHELRVSLDGATPQTVHAITGADVFDAVVGNTTALVAERGQGPVPWISLWMMATRRNIAELPDLVRLAADIGVEEVYLQRLVLTGHGVATQEHSLHGKVDDAVRAIVARAEALAEETGVALRASGRVPILESLSRSRSDNPRLGCWRPWRSAVVTAGRRVVPCCISAFTTPYEVLEMGRLGEQSWEEVWNGERYQAVRRGILEGPPYPSCQGCSEQWSL